MSSNSITARLAAQASLLDLTNVPGEAVTVAKQCCLDWLGVTLAARAEPLAEMLVATAAEDGGNADCTLVGRGSRASLAQAVLINGAMGHALDYDDVIVPMGHPTVPVAPVVFAMGERENMTGLSVLTAFIAGVETECRIARLLGRSHYERGWHSTATFGTFGAAAATGRMLALNDGLMAQAFGIAGTQAAGLKSVFGTMCKPLHAGKAAANGLLAARLAARGFTSNPAILEAEQGFGETQSSGIDIQAALENPSGGFYVRHTLFKYHAACYLTHSAINAALRLSSEHEIEPAAIESVAVGVDPGHLKVCAIPEPETGLECKFSLRMTVAMALAGENTADENLYSDATARRQDLIDLRRKIAIVPRSAPSSTLSDVSIRLTGGKEITATADVAVAAADVLGQWDLLQTKFRVLADPIIGRDRSSEIIARLRNLENEPSVRPLMMLLGYPQAATGRAERSPP